MQYATAKYTVILTKKGEGKLIIGFTRVEGLKDFFADVKFSLGKFFPGSVIIIYYFLEVHTCIYICEKDYCVLQVPHNVHGGVITISHATLL